MLEAPRPPRQSARTRPDAATAYAVAASRMKRPISDDGSRCLLSEWAGQLPSAVSWFAESHANARLRPGCSGPAPVWNSTKAIMPVAYPSLSVKQGACDAHL